jgi:hypothetical protein
LTDGLGASTFFLATSGNYDSSALAGLKPFPWWKELMIMACIPFLLLRSTWNILTTFRDNNAVKKCDLPLTGNRKGALWRNLD